MKYSKKQIFEALSYWQKQLKKQLNEAEESNQDAMLHPEMITQMIKAKYPTANVTVEEDSEGSWQGVLITINLKTQRDMQISPNKQLFNIGNDIYQTLDLYPAELLSNSQQFNLKEGNEMSVTLIYQYGYDVNDVNDFDF